MIWFMTLLVLFCVGLSTPKSADEALICHACAQNQKDSDGNKNLSLQEREKVWGKVCGQCLTDHGKCFVCCAGEDVCIKMCKKTQTDPAVTVICNQKSLKI